MSSFYARRSQKSHKAHNLTIFFALLWSASVKAARKTFVQLTSGHLNVVALSATKLKALDEIRDIPSQKRKCYFTGTMKFTKLWKQINKIHNFYLILLFLILTVQLITIQVALLMPVMAKLRPEGNLYFFLFLTYWFSTFFGSRPPY